MNKIITWLLLITVATHSHAQINFSVFDKAIVQLNREKAFNGAVLVAKNGNILYQKNIGYADIEHNTPISTNTSFELASITKSFTSVLILQLVEQGKIKLDAPVTNYIPEFTRSDSGQITIHHLLSHTSGLQDFVGLSCEFASWTKKEFMEGMQKTPVHFKPGTQFEYSSSTYVLLRFIIEQVTGKSYEANVKENIFNIAGMTHSGIIHNRDLIKDRALGYTMEDGKYKNALPVANHEIFIGAASMYSTAQDLLKFDQALYTEKLLKQKEKDLMFTVVQPPYGYGWFISDDAAKGKTVSHGGDIFGFTSLLERRLKNKVTIIILSNLEGVDRDKIIKAGIATGL